jgi:hypothetical protein
MTPAAFRARAAELERTAETALSPELKLEFLKMAKGWRDLADGAEHSDRRAASASPAEASSGD